MDGGGGGDDYDYDDKGRARKRCRPFIRDEFMLLSGELVFIIPCTNGLTVPSIVITFGAF
jgi:hypothetical protein